jgi:DNA-binding CsgD family transcriptional regulator
MACRSRAIPSRSHTPPPRYFRGPWCDHLLASGRSPGRYTPERAANVGEGLGGAARRAIARDVHRRSVRFRPGWRPISIVAAVSQLATETDPDPAAPSPWHDVVARSSRPVFLIDLSTRRVVARSKAAEALVGPIEWAYDLTPHREQSRKRLDLLQSGLIDGYHFTGTLTTPSGSPLELDVGAQRVNDTEGGDLALILLSPHDGDTAGHPADVLEALDASNSLDASHSPDDLDAPLLVGTVDQDWRIERLGNEVKEVLGYDPGAVIGTLFTHWVYPGDIGNLFIGVGRALEDNASVTVRVRVRHADKSWLPMVAVLVPLTGPAPETGFAFVLRTDHEADSDAPEGSGSSSDRIAALEHRLWRIALELKAAGIVQQVRHLPDFRHVPEVNDLTSRQLEVLTRLLEGQRVPTIAAETYVSTSTVRNHLAAIYRKLGVHSQAELLAKVRRPQ